MNLLTYATNAHQDIFTLGKTDGDLRGLAADVHQLGILVRNSLSQEEDGVLVLLVTHPAGRPGQKYTQVKHQLELNANLALLPD